MHAPDAAAELPLFPLREVLFPGGLLNLKVFEARYLDLMSRCLRDRTPFGVVGLKRGTEVRQPEQSVELESVGTQAELMDVDSAQAGILLVRCRGSARFEVRSSRQQGDGLWLARTTPIAADDRVAPTPALGATVRGLADAVAALDSQGTQPFLLPHHFDDAGWVANRWCEVLAIPVAAKQRLMELRDPLVRLELVDEFLRSKGVVP